MDDDKKFIATVVSESVNVSMSLNTSDQNFLTDFFNSTTDVIATRIAVARDIHIKELKDLLILKIERQINDRNKQLQEIITNHGK